MEGGRNAHEERECRGSCEHRSSGERERRREAKAHSAMIRRSAATIIAGCSMETVATEALASPDSPRGLDVSVVIPCLNEAEGIVAVVDEAQRALHVAAGSPARSSSSTTPRRTTRLRSRGRPAPPSSPSHAADTGARTSPGSRPRGATYDRHGRCRRDVSARPHRRVRRAPSRRRGHGARLALQGDDRAGRDAVAEPLSRQSVAHRHAQSPLPQRRLRRALRAAGGAARCAAGRCSCRRPGWSSRPRW